MRLIFFILLSLFGMRCVSIAAPPRGPTDSQTSRTLRSFDFEERASGNVEDTPLGWVKVEGSGMPHYLKGQFDFSIAHSGQTSFRMDLNGGSIAFRYPANRIPVTPDALYRVGTMVRTTELKNARARLSVYFCDIDGNAIKSSIRFVDLEPRVAEDEAFHALSIDLIAEKNAASLVVEIGVLQPSLLGTFDLGEHQLSGRFPT